MHVFCVTQNVGAARALSPVVQQLYTYPQVQITLFAEGKAIQSLEQEGIVHKKIVLLNEHILIQVAQGVFKEINIDVLLMGNAWGMSLDKVVIDLANKKGIPSVSVVDMWSNYKERFTNPLSGEINFPSKIAIMDQFAYEQAIADGIPASRLVITGQPYLETLPARLKKDEIRQQASLLRETWLMNTCQKDTCIILFASESFARDYTESSCYPGYTEVDAIEGLVSAIKQIEWRMDVKPVVVIKLHPDQPLESFQIGSLARQAGVMIAESQSAWSCILAADIVVGMTSMFLIESAFAGRPTISFQPTQRQKNPFIGTVIGAVPTATSVPELIIQLEKYIVKMHDNKPENKAPYPEDRLLQGHQGAALRIAKMVLDIGKYKYHRKCHEN